jgi:capsular polysaccharide biosynthesis protein
VARALETEQPVTLIDAATMSPRDQIDAFSSACVLVGQHGAGLANMVWMPAGSKVIEILPPVREDAGELFRDLADTLGLSYGRVVQESLHSEVDPADVLQALQSAPSPRFLGPAERARRRLLRAGKITEVRMLRSSALRWPVRLVR